MLTSENYFSKEMNMKYMSASQYKSFTQCEAGALAELNGEIEREKTVSMLVGSYVDAHYEKSLDLFKAQNPEIYTQKGTLKSEYKHAEYIIERLERDELFQLFMSGEKQVVNTGLIEGIPFKCKIDSYHFGSKDSEDFRLGRMIVDLKVMKDFERIWKDGLKLSFVEAWGYDFQGAIYQEIEGNKLPFFIAGVTKEKEPDLAIIEVPQSRLDYCIDLVKNTVQGFDWIKKGILEPERCEKCNYCRQTKKLTTIISYEDIGA